MPRGVSTSSWCVCQFHHLRTEVNSTSIAKAEGAENHGCLALIDLAAFDAVNDGKSGQHAHASGLAQ